MRELWRLDIEAREQGIDPDRLFLEAKDYSPYYQLALGTFNSYRVKDSLDCGVSVNPYIRYEQVFDALLLYGLEEHTYFIRILTDVMLHVLCEIDLPEGLRKSELKIRMMADNLAEGIFGGIRADALFSRGECRTIANCLRLLYATDAYLHCFIRALTALFPGSYAERRDVGELLIFLSRSKTEELERKVSYLIDLFLQVDSVYTVYWDKMPGVIGYEETMALENFLLA